MSRCPPEMSKALFDSGAGLSCSVATDYSLYVISALPTPDDIRKICASSECKRAISVLKSKQPSECISGFNFKLYEQILNPIEAGCGSGGGGGAGGGSPPTPAPPPPSMPQMPPMPPLPPMPTPAPPPPPTTAASPPPPQPQPTPAPPATTVTPPTAPPGNGTLEQGSIALYRNSTGGTSSSTITNKTTESSDSSNMTVIIGIVAGVIVVVAIVAFIAFRAGRRKKNNSNENNRSPRTLSSAYAAVPNNRKRPAAAVARPAPRLTAHPVNHEWSAPPRHIEVASPVTAPPSSSNARSSAAALASSNTGTSVASTVVSESAVTALCNDTAIQKARIPLEEITMDKEISKGAYGVVLLGSYKGEIVAVKKLVPDKRKNMKEIESFLEEAKLLISLKHQRIVLFVGVAWDSLTDLCVVTEFMDGGDLREYLAHADANGELTGFDANKVKIVLHIIHALSYLHSLKPKIVHRDLKSKNVLLTQLLDAKLTDFGVSRERADATMTANVGSSLWMAPEVMLGERYDEKADIFSFGVMVSELDTQKLPYSHATEPGSDRKLPEMALLNMVSAGRLTVAFTEDADEDMVQIGRDCVAVDPKARPTASDVLHHMHKIYRGYLQV